MIIYNNNNTVAPSSSIDNTLSIVAPSNTQVIPAEVLSVHDQPSTSLPSEVTLNVQKINTETPIRKEDSKEVKDLKNILESKLLQILDDKPETLIRAVTLMSPQQAKYCTSILKRFNDSLLPTSSSTPSTENLNKRICIQNEKQNENDHVSIIQSIIFKKSLMSNKSLQSKLPNQTLSSSNKSMQITTLTTSQVLPSNIVSNQDNRNIPIHTSLSTKHPNQPRRLYMVTSSNGLPVIVPRAVMKIYPVETISTNMNSSIDISNSQYLQLQLLKSSPSNKHFS